MLKIYKVHDTLFNLFFIIFISFPVGAEGVLDKYTTSQRYGLCIKDAIGSYDYLSCIESEIKIQDKRLNFNYKKAVKNLSQKRKNQLRDIQRTWVKYRNQKCSFFYHKHSGSGGVLDMAECSLEETVRRADELGVIF